VEFEEFERVKRYIGFGQDTSAALCAFADAVELPMSELVDDVCRLLEEDSGSRRLASGSERLERFRRALLGWSDSSLRGPYDASYLEACSRIGQLHAQLGLPVQLLVVALSRIRTRLIAWAERAPEPSRRTESIQAIHKVVDLELAIMADAYRSGLEVRLRAQERLATIGQLASSIGHELRSPLGVIESSTFLIRQRLTPTHHTEAVLRHLDKIGAQVRVCSTTTAELLELARNRPPACRQVVVRDLVAAAIEGAGNIPPHSVDLDIPEGLTMRADPDQMRQVLVNLVRNARQAHDGQGHIWITAEGNADGTSLRVRDDGPGIPAAIRDQVFDPLFTTKAHGTGLGLALCRRIVEAHQGEITLEPTEVGASFRVSLPSAEAAKNQPVEERQGNAFGVGT
jgi:two-component system, NtrC family, sensor histidine kinase HydH